MFPGTLGLQETETRYSGISRDCAWSPREVGDFIHGSRTGRGTCHQAVQGSRNCTRCQGSTSCAVLIFGLTPQWGWAELEFEPRADESKGWGLSHPAARALAWSLLWTQTSSMWSFPSSAHRSLSVLHLLVTPGHCSVGDFISFFISLCLSRCDGWEPQNILNGNRHCLGVQAR